MAKYTMELRSLQADFYNAMQTYPIFDETYREKLNDKIYHALKYREIGYETPELFCEMLEQWMELNMPRYNWLYKSNLIELTPLQRAKILELSRGVTDTKEDSTTTNDITKKVDGTETNTNNNQTVVDGTVLTNEDTTDTTNSTQNTTDTSNSDSTNNDKSYNSDFPQANLGDKDDSNYYTTGDISMGQTHNESEGTTNSTGNSTSIRDGEVKTDTDSTTTSNGSSQNVTDSTETENGEEVYDMKSQVVDTIEKERTGNESKTDFELLDEYRKSFLNVDAKLIRALKRELFMNIW